MRQSSRLRRQAARGKCSLKADFVDERWIWLVSLQAFILESNSVQSVQLVRVLQCFCMHILCFVWGFPVKRYKFAPQVRLSFSNAVQSM